MAADTPSLNVLAHSYFFPPMQEPRAVQVHRLLTHLSANTLLFCAGEDNQLPQPLNTPTGALKVRRLAPMPATPGWARGKLAFLARGLPDEFRAWNQAALDKALHTLQNTCFTPDVVITFGMPMSDHLLGLNLKVHLGAPWVAHFSDPWLANPFVHRNGLSHWLNQRMEERVLAQADRLVFTSEETVDLVMAPYAKTWRKKCRVLPHSYDPLAYGENHAPPADAYVLRSLGKFYGPRSPQPLLLAMDNLRQSQPTLLEGVRLELIGQWENVAVDATLLERLAPWVSRLPPVDYAQSLRLMKTAHCLVAVDAPADTSPFFPSKLADYFGADRFVFSVTPPGAAARLTRQVGGAVANPADMAEVTRVLADLLTHRPSRPAQPQAARGYEAGQVADQMLGLLREVVATPAPSSS